MLRSLALVILLSLPAAGARTFVHTDTAAPQCSEAEAIACSDLTVAVTGSAGRQEDEGAAAGSSEVTWTMTNGDANAVCHWRESDQIGEDTSWPSGTWTMRLNVTTAEEQSVVNAKICRVNSDCSSVLGTVGNDATVTSLFSTGTKTFTISGAAQTANATDLFLVVFDCREDQAHGNTTVGITPSLSDDTPLTAPAATRNRAVMIQ